MTTNTRILIVDRSEDSREVLRIALERRGVEILEASGLDDGLALAHQHHPKVIVLDIEHETGASDDPCRPFAEPHGGKSPSLVVLGRAKLPVSTSPDGPPAQVGHFLSKPYHYGPLIRKIEELLV